MKISEQLLKGRRVAALMVNGEGVQLDLKLEGYFQGIEDGFLILSDTAGGMGVHLIALDYIAGVAELAEGVPQ